VWLGGTRTGIVIFSPREMHATLQLTASPGRAVANRPQRLVVTSRGEPREVWVSEYPRVDLPMLLGRGAGRVEIAFPEEIGEGEDRRRLCVLEMTLRPADR
jgi:hypothetical protein